MLHLLEMASYANVASSAEKCIEVGALSASDAPVFDCASDSISIASCRPYLLATISSRDRDHTQS